MERSTGRDDIPIANALRSLRQAAGLSQGELARLAGTTRQTIGALEAGSYAPTLAVALRLARALDCQMDELFWLERPWPTVAAELLPTPVPDRDAPLRVQVARVGDRTIARPLDAFGAADGLVSAAAAGRATIRLLGDPELLDRTVVLLGCDPALTTLGAHLQRRHARHGLRLLVGHSGSLAALAALARGEAHIAGMHVLDEGSGEYNLPFVRRQFAGRRVLVVTAAHWSQGLIVAPGNPRGIAGPADLARPDLAVINREPGSGSHAMLDHALRDAGIAPALVRGYERIAASHRAVAEIVASGLADAGPGIQAAAVALGLGFIPLAEERVDFVIPAEHRDTAPVQALLDTLTSAPFRAEIAALPGYDISQTGKVVAEELVG